MAILNLITQDTSLYLIGAGGHAAVVAEAAMLCGAKIEAAFAETSSTTFSHMSIPLQTSQAPLEDSSWVQGKNFAVAIGDNEKRRKLTQKLVEQGGNIVTIIHPSASISTYADIDIGCFIGSQTMIGVGVKLGAYVIVNSKASIDHESDIGQACHIACGAVLCGEVSLGKLVLVGAGATIIPGIKVEDRVLIAAGSTVVKNITAGSKVFGTPAKRLT